MGCPSGALAHGVLGINFGYALTAESRCGTNHKSRVTVAQLDRVSGYEPEGRGFESLQSRQEKPRNHGVFRFLWALFEVSKMGLFR